MTETGYFRTAGGLETRVVLKEEVRKELVIFVMQRCTSVLSTENNTQGQNSTLYTKYSYVVCMELPSFHLNTANENLALCVSHIFRPQYHKKLCFEFGCCRPCPEGVSLNLSSMSILNNTEQKLQFKDKQSTIHIKILIVSNW